MAIVTSEDGRRGILGILIAWLNTLTINLYTNDFTPEILSVPTDFDVPTYDQYAPIKLANWAGVYWSEQGTARTQADPVVFRVGPLGGLDTIYGYWVTDQFGHFVWGERNPAGPLPMMRAGERYPINPRYDIGTLCP